jgi:hypothetical protein
VNVLSKGTLLLCLYPLASYPVGADVQDLCSVEAQEYLRTVLGLQHFSDASFCLFRAKWYAVSHSTPMSDLFAGSLADDICNRRDVAKSKLDLIRLTKTAITMVDFTGCIVLATCARSTWLPFAGCALQLPQLSESQRSAILGAFPIIYHQVSQPSTLRPLSKSVCCAPIRLESCRSAVLRLPSRNHLLSRATSLANVVRAGGFCVFSLITSVPGCCTGWCLLFDPFGEEELEHVAVIAEEYKLQCDEGRLGSHPAFVTQSLLFEPQLYRRRPCLRSSRAEKPLTFRTRRSSFGARRSFTLVACPDSEPGLLAQRDSRPDSGRREASTLPGREASLQVIA